MFAYKKLILAAVATGIALTTIASATPAFAREATDQFASYKASLPATAAIATGEPVLFDGSQFARTNARATADVVLDDFTPVMPMVFAYLGVPASGDTTFGLVGTGGTTSGAPAPLGPQKFKAGVGCSIQCITSGVAYARNAGAKLRVKTDTYAKIRIEVWDDSHFWSFESDPGVMQFDAHFDMLQANTAYHARALALDSQGYEAEAEGQFTTLRRSVRVTIGHADVSDHVYSESDFSKHVWAEGEWLDQYQVGGLELNGGAVDWGDNVILLSDVPRYLDFAVEMTERNTDVSGPQQALPGPSDDGPSYGQGNGYVHAYATLHDNDLDDRPGSPTSWTEHTLNLVLEAGESGEWLPGGYGSALEFTVPITLEVMYH